MWGSIPVDYYSCNRDCVKQSILFCHKISTLTKRSKGRTFNYWMALFSSIHFPSAIEIPVAMLFFFFSTFFSWRIIKKIKSPNTFSLTLRFYSSDKKFFNQIISKNPYRIIKQKDNEKYFYLNSLFQFLVIFTCNICLLLKLLPFVFFSKIFFQHFCG